MGLQTFMRTRSWLGKALLSVLALAMAASATERQNNADYRARRVALAKSMDGGSLVLFAPTEAEGPNDLYGFPPGR